MFHPWRTRSRVKLETNRYNKKVPISPPTNGEGLSRCFSRPLLRTLWGEGSGLGGVVAGTSRRRLGGKRRWMEEGRDDEGAKPDSRPGRVDSLANFQIYTLAVRSRAGCFEEREGRKGAASGHWTGTMVGILHGFLAQCSIFFARACVCVPLSTRTCFPLSPLSCWASFAAREQVESSISGIRMGWLLWKVPRPFGSPRFNAPITMRMKAVVSSWDVGWIKKGIYFGFPSFLIKLF